MASQLAGQVVMGPLNFDAPTDYLHMHSDLETDKLDATLVKLSQTVAKNAKVTNGMKDEITALRAHIDNSAAKLQRSINVLDDSTRALKEQLFRVADEVKALQGSALKRHDYDVDKDLMWKEHRAASSFIEEYNSTRGHIDRVQAWVKDFLPLWYSGIQAAAAEALDERLKKSTDETRAVVADDLKREAELIAASTKNMHAVIDTRMSTVEQKQRSFGDRIEDLDTRVSRQQRLANAIGAGVDEAKEAAGQAAQLAEATRDKAAGDAEGILALLGCTMEDMLRFVDIAAANASASASVRGGTPQQSPRSGSIVSPHSVSDRPPAGRPGSGRSATDSPSHSQQSVLPRHRRGSGNSPVRQARVVVRDPEGAAAFLAQLPPFRAVAMAATTAASEQVDALGTKLRKEVADAVSSVDAKLADKVGVSRLKELLEKNRDEKLVRSVEQLQKEVAHVKESKIDTARFNSALATKADRAALDSKADRSFVESAVQLATAKAEAVAAEFEPVRNMALDASTRAAHALNTSTATSATTVTPTKGAHVGGAPPRDSPASSVAHHHPSGDVYGATQQYVTERATDEASRRKDASQNPAHSQRQASSSQSHQGGLYDATVGPRARVGGAYQHQQQQHPPGTAPAGGSRPPMAQSARHERAAEYEPGSLTGSTNPSAGRAAAVPPQQFAASARVGSGSTRTHGTPGSQGTQGPDSDAGHDGPAVDAVVTPRRGRGRGRGGRGRGRGAAHDDYEARGATAEDGPSPRGLPSGLGDVLHRMSAEDYRYERHGDARLLSSPPRRGEYPPPPED